MKPEIKKYVKKPVVIEAYRTDAKVEIHTLEGDMVFQKTKGPESSDPIPAAEQFLR